MTGEHSWRRRFRWAAVLVAAVVGVVAVGLAAPARAQTTDSPAAVCTVAGRPCFTADQLRQLAKVGDDVMARRVAPTSPAAAAARVFVDHWVGYSVALGYAVASSFLPG